MIRKIRLNLKFIKLITEKKINVKHILPNKFRSNSNQTMNIYQLLKYNVRNIFIQNSYVK